MTKEHTPNKVFDVKGKLHGFRTTPDLERMVQEILGKLEGGTETEKWHRLIKIVHPMWNGGSKKEVKQEMVKVREGRTYCPKAKCEVSLEECKGCKDWEREACEELKEENARMDYPIVKSADNYS